MSHFNQLTPAQQERLAILSEELGEVQQVVGKILRHGIESPNPTTKITNRQNLQTELGDIMAILEIMLAHGDVDKEKIDLAKQVKLNKIWRWMHHNDMDSTYSAATENKKK